MISDNPVRDGFVALGLFAGAFLFFWVIDVISAWWEVRKEIKRKKR